MARQHADHFVRTSVGVFERLRQVHEAAALRVDGTTLVEHEAPHALSAARVVREPLGVELGIAAAEIEAVDVRRLGV